MFYGVDFYGIAEIATQTQSLHFKYSTTVMIDVTMQDLFNKDGISAGFYCIECEDITIRDSTFKNLKGVLRSAIYLENTEII